MQAYNRIDQHLHQLTQIIAKANRSFVPKKEDDSHTNLYFDPLAKRIYGRWIESEKGRHILALNLIDFQFEWLNDHLEILQAIKVENKTSQHIELNIKDGFKDLGLIATGFQDELHFTITNYDFKNLPFKKLQESALNSWIHYRQFANTACQSLLDHIQAEGEIRIWPHHFDTGVYAEPNQKIGFGFGLAMEDSMVGKPYFYFSAYGLKGTTLNFEKTKKLSRGEWHLTEYWKGAVLPLDALDSSPQLTIETFIAEISQWYLLGI